MDTMAAHWPPAGEPVPPQPADPETVGEPEGDSTVESGEAPTTESLDPSGEQPIGEQVVQSPKQEDISPEEPAVVREYDVEELRLQREAVVHLDFSSQFFSSFSLGLRF